MNPAKRLDTIISRYIDARLAESESNIYSIRPINKDDYEGYYILLKPKCGIFKDCNYILSMHTNAPNNSKSSIELFPIKPPRMHFVSNCYHTNVGTSGWICLDTLMSNWVPSYSFITIIQNILIFLETPNTSSPANCLASKDWSCCEKVFLTRTKNRNLTIKDEEDIRDECFIEYINKLKIQNDSKNFTKYYSYFPELNPNISEKDALDITTEQEEFDNLVALVNEKAEKKKSIIQNRKAKVLDKLVDKVHSKVHSKVVDKVVDKVHGKVESPVESQLESPIESQLESPVESKNISILEMKKMQISKLSELIEEFSKLKEYQENINSDNNIIDLLSSLEIEKSIDKNMINIKKAKDLELEYKTKLESITNDLILILKISTDIVDAVTSKEEQMVTEVNELNKRKKKWSKYQNTNKV